MESAPLDHLTILSRDAGAAARFYGVLLPLLGFSRRGPTIWANGQGLFLQFRAAAEGTADYGRHAPGLNHFGFRAHGPDHVHTVKAAMDEAGIEARLQTFGDGTLALFIPDPDGLRVELAWYPPGVDPVN